MSRSAGLSPRAEAGRRTFLRRLGLTSAAAAAAPALLAQSSSSPLADPSGLRIADVKVYRWSRAIYVKVETDDPAVFGWGESSSNSPQQVVAQFIRQGLRPIVLGADPFDVEPLWDRMFWENHDLGPAGALTYAIAGVDLALWDLKGRALGLPVHKLLGGSYRDRVPAYCGIPLYAGSVPVEEAVERALRIVDLGFRIVKLRMQIREYNLNPTPDPTLRYYTAIREALPDEVELFVDPNEGYTAARAIQVGRELADMGMRWYESPCPLEAGDDLRQVVEALDIPVLAGEKTYTRWQVRDLIAQANLDIIQPDPIKAGGITELRKIAALAQAHFKPLAPHNTKPTLGTAASLHLLASASNMGPFLEFVELDTYGEVLPAIRNPLALEDGMLRVPSGPGLGLEVDEDYVRRVAEG